MSAGATLEDAPALDAADPLRPLRAHFALPRARPRCALTYLCGHSLGLQPLAARALVEQELDDWAQLAVEGHEHARRPWMPYHRTRPRDLPPSAGARPDEVVAMNSLTVNLHLMLASFYRPHRGARAASSSRPVPSPRTATRSPRSSPGTASTRQARSSNWPRARAKTRCGGGHRGVPRRARRGRSRWCCGPGCSSAPGRRLSWRASRVPRTRTAASPASIWRTRSATCRSRCTTRRPTSPSGAATST